MKRFLPGLPLLFAVTNLVAQTTPADDAAASPTSAGDAAGGAAAGLAALGCGVLPCIIWVAIIIGMAVFVYKDAKKRGMDNAVLLTILTVVTGPLGLIIYLVMRPKGPVPPSTGV
jgi:hypothetical protein